MVDFVLTFFVCVIEGGRMHRCPSAKFLFFAAKGATHAIDLPVRLCALMLALRWRALKASMSSSCFRTVFSKERATVVSYFSVRWESWAGTLRLICGFT